MLLPLAGMLALIVAFFWCVSAQLRPVIRTMAVSQATNLISSLIGDIIDDCLTADGLGYADFITIETDSTGRVTSLTGNLTESSRFRRQVVDAMVRRLEDLEPDALGIPIGSLTGRMLLSDVGPKVRVRIKAVGDVTAEYVSAFSAAGVNQTRHEVYLNLAVTVYLLIPGEIVPVTVESGVCVAETVIVGEVPNTYIHLEKGEL